MAPDSQDSEAVVLDRKRALEEDDSELIVTDNPELFEEINDIDQSQEDVGSEIVTENSTDRKPFKRSKPEEKNTLPVLSLRLLIPTNYSGLVIGRSGSTIAAIKERSDAKVSISEMIHAAPDRILIATGNPEEVAQAIYEVAQILVRAENQQYKTDESAYKKLTMRFLIPHEIMGAIIGKGAVKVKEIQKMSNCRISAEQGLLFDSTERKMNVIGDADCIRVAIAMISHIILEFPASVAANIPFKPRPYLESNPVPTMKSNQYSNPQLSYGQIPYNPYAIPPLQETVTGYPQNYYVDPQEYSQSPYMAQPFLNPPYSHSSILPFNNQSYGHAISSNPYANNSIESFHSIPTYPSQIINVPIKFVGVLIGKAGRHINEMRRVSRCDIEMLELAPGGPVEERQFKITGPPQQIAIAVGMIGARLEAERRRIAKYGA